MDHELYAGIDCGATKVLVHSVIVDSKTKILSPGKIYKEYLYEDHPDWNKDFSPIPIDSQLDEYKNKNVTIREFENIQSNVIIKTIQLGLTQIKGFKIGLCFPGIKNKNDIVVLSNGPRIMNLNKNINFFDTIQNDSDCCLIGEWRSTIGKMKNINNGVYIGGGTGIADGIILNDKIVDFNNHPEKIKRSWELLLPSGESVESWLSPAGMIKKYNLIYDKNIRTIEELSRSKESDHIFDQVQKAFSFLINDRIAFFKKNNINIEKIVIGQRLGNFLANENKNIKELFLNYKDIPIDFSPDRRVAALGAVWKLLC